MILKVHVLKAAKMDDYFALMFKAMKSDQSVPRVVAFVKRLLQMAFLNEANFVAATLLVISEILKVRSDVRLEVYRFTSKRGQDLPSKVISAAAKKGNGALDDEDDDEEEVFQDVDRAMEE